MREILFRAKRPNGEWRVGNLLFYPDVNRAFMSSGDYKSIGGTVEVDKKTIGQFTGLTDKNGKKIFEGDILEGLCGLHEVYFDEDFVCFNWKNISGKQKESFSGFADEYEIIGNVHNNPELIQTSGISDNT